MGSTRHLPASLKPTLPPAAERDPSPWPQGAGSLRARLLQPSSSSQQAGRELASSLDSSAGHESTSPSPCHVPAGSSRPRRCQIPAPPGCQLRQGVKSSVLGSGTGCALGQASGWAAARLAQCRVRSRRHPPGEGGGRRAGLCRQRSRSLGLPAKKMWKLHRTGCPDPPPRQIFLLRRENNRRRPEGLPDEQLVLLLIPP